MDQESKCYSSIKFYQDKLNSKRSDEHEKIKYYIKKFGKICIPPRLIMEKELVSFMRQLASNSPNVKREADSLAEKWQQQVDQWKQPNKSMNPIQERLPQMNGKLKANQMPSGSNDRRNYCSSSSVEHESPISERTNLRNTSLQESNNTHSSSTRKSPSPLLMENSVAQTIANLKYSPTPNIPAQFNANLSIDTKEVTSSNRTRGTPIKPNGRFSIAMKENMFKAVKLDKPVSEEALHYMYCIFRFLHLSRREQYPSYLEKYAKNEDRKEALIALRKKKNTQETMEPRKQFNYDHSPRTIYNSYDKSPTYQPGAIKSSKNCPKSKQNMEKNRTMVDEKKETYPDTQNNKLKDTKGAYAMGSGVRNGDKNYIKEKDSPDESAMLAITSSKKERTSVYHGKKSNISEIPSLKNISHEAIKRMVKHHPDPSKFFNVYASFEDLESFLVTMSPQKLLKVEEKMKYLKEKTDPIWKMHFKSKIKNPICEKKENENWRTYYQRECRASERRLKSLTASISTSKGKPDRQIKLVSSVDGPAPKRQKTEHLIVPKINAKNSANNIPPNFSHIPSVNGFATNYQKKNCDMVPKNNAKISSIKVPPNFSHTSNYRSEAPVPTGMSNHIKSSHKPIKKDAPLMHKVKKSLGQLHRNHRN